MKVLILTLGTRGDVQPFVALAEALRNAGHETVMCAPLTSQSLVDGYGIQAEYFNDGWNELMKNPKLRERLEGKRDSLLNLTQRYISAEYRTDPWRKMAEVGRQGADIVVHSYVAPGNQIAELLQIPSTPVYLQPYPLSRTSPHLPKPVSMSFFSIKQLYTKTFEYMLYGDIQGQWRQNTLKLTKRRGAENPMRAPDGSKNLALQAFSQHVVPDATKNKKYMHTTGYWYLPTPPSWQPPRQLLDFIEAGTRPVYVGFGSLIGADPAHTARVVMEALQMTRTRAVVATGGGGLDAEEFGDDMFVVDQIPHDWLFPQMSAIVHAGGAGTIAAALSAGRPQVVCPFTVDQPFWAHRMHKLGVASSPQPQRSLESGSLAHAIRRAVTDKAMFERAQWLKKQVQSEEGTNAAVKVIESLVQQR